MLDLFDFLSDLNFAIKCLEVFGLLFLVDVAYSFYTVYAAKGRKYLASIWAAAIIIISGLGISVYLQDLRLLAPAALGAGLGTLFALNVIK